MYSRFSSNHYTNIIGVDGILIIQSCIVNTGKKSNEKTPTQRFVSVLHVNVYNNFQSSLSIIYYYNDDYTRNDIATIFIIEYMTVGDEHIIRIKPEK